MNHFVSGHLGVLIGIGLACLFFAIHGSDRRSPPATLSWLLLIGFLPWFGVPLFLLLGGRKIRGRQRPAPIRGAEADDAPQERGTARLLLELGLPNETQGNRTALCADGVVTYEALLELIEAAQRSIFVETYILRPDSVGDALARALARRAEDGIEVRLLLDGFGSLAAGRLLPRMQHSGVAVRIFNPLSPPRAGLLTHASRIREWQPNLRNHRKLVVIDDDRALIGGTNVAREYIGPTPYPGRWIDYTLRVEGPAAAQLADSFRFDWSNSRLGETDAIDRQLTTDARRTRSPRIPPTIASGNRVQVVSSGPDTAEDALYAVLVSAIFEARERVWIVSPYFVPDTTMQMALELAAKRGVDLRIVTPLRSNRGIVNFARTPSLRRLERAGAKVLLRPGRMVHAKLVLVDRELVCIGSANFDDRSMFLNYELALLITSTSQNAELATWAESLMSNATLGLPPSGWGRQLAEQLAQLVAPEL